MPDAPDTPNAERQANQVTSVYAQALVELATEAGALDPLADEARAVLTLLATEPDLTPLLESPAISASDRAGMLDRLFGGGKLSDTMVKFLQVLNRKGRLDALGGILADFLGKVDAEHGVVEAQLFVASELNEEDAQRVAGRVGEAMGGKTIRLDQRIDPKLIGGLKLRVGDALLDGSVATQLKRMRNEMVRLGRERAPVDAAALK